MLLLALGQLLCTGRGIPGEPGGEDGGGGATVTARRPAPVKTPPPASSSRCTVGLADVICGAAAQRPKATSLLTAMRPSTEESAW